MTRRREMGLITERNRSTAVPLYRLRVALSSLWVAFRHDPPSGVTRGCHAKACQFIKISGMYSLSLTLVGTRLHTSWLLGEISPERS
jgi:hypothetical protein